MTTSNSREATQTPYLLLEEAKIKKNVASLYDHINKLGCYVRPHLKTLRSLQAASLLLKDLSSPATVSTLAEAEAFASAGYLDLLYAVGIEPHKLDRVIELSKNGATIHILLDSVTQAKAVVECAAEREFQFSAFIEIDCDGHRGGILPDNALLLEIGRILESGGVSVTGVLTHAGESYHCQTQAEIQKAARNECLAALTAARHLREAGIRCPVVSVGSTPTAHRVDDLSGITEVRAGVFSTFDLFMKNVGVCTTEDIAISVVTTVIGHNLEKRWLFVDAGWMALSRDRGTASQVEDYGYGLVCDMEGKPLNYTVASVSQEHGIVILPEDDKCGPENFPLGTRLRILPNHACATASMHDVYRVKQNDEVDLQLWDRIRGW
ncbi:alanine racemase [Mangrovibacter yixingensis]|uniref:alanine racemase n=1 Tax=Mangrovibacter yixingensis TaxID=1529639 RepID=UPI001CFAA348|nr:alanine racemase [Mangrovibacter yixingensis]